ncbi:MAG: CooT family nickel-binding protein [Archaeoglobaceae archaeon]
MCESKVISRGEILFEDIVQVKVESDRLLFFDILGNRREIKGKILEVDLLGHKITVEVFQ